MNKQDKEDKRKNKRYHFRENIMIDNMMVKGTCIDISEGGLYISTLQNFEENNVISVSIPFRGKKVTLKGQVQHFDPGIGIGIKFIDLNDKQTAIIKELIKKKSGNK
jgi:hypothetical protein